MPFKNRIRLPLQLHSAQFPEERTVFRKANGQSKTLSVVIRKVYDLETDFMPEIWHQRLKISLSHDIVTVESERYLGDISQDGDYNIEWPEGVLHYPTAKGGVKVQVTPFDATNSNCQTCEEATQLSLSDDIATGIYGNLTEDTDYTVNASDNDNICCYPAVFSLVSFNSDYLDSCTIDPATGIVSMHTGSDLISANGILLATYRVTCPDGSYDEADITANIDGSSEGCLAPTSLDLNGTSQTTGEVSWDEPEPGGTYYWELYIGSVPSGSPEQSGTITGNNLTISGLTAGTLYYFQIRTVCYGSNSNYVSGQFSTPPAEVSCGSYQIYNSSTDSPGFKIIGYVNCAGQTTTVTVFNLNSTIVCALENSPGDPAFLSSTDPNITITYLGPC